MKKLILLITLSCAAFNIAGAQQKTLHQLQQDFVDQRFGMFIHFNMPTFFNADWPDPDASPEVFNPVKMDCSQWAKAARSANMTYGCLTTKHHSGFCIWDTKTTDYSVMSSPFKRDVVKEYADAFRAEGLGVSLYYSILDTHHKIRPGFVSPAHIRMIKDQLRELLTGYGKIDAIIIDGWDAPWSRLSYDEIPFEDIYYFIKSIQPDCLVMELNAAKYPTEALFYTDLKSYEQGAGQHISKESNVLPALSCLPLQDNWFWKESFPGKPVKSPEKMVNDNIIPMGKVYCNFLLNVAPNRDGLFDRNAIEALAEIGKLWKSDGKISGFPVADAPIISSNLAIGMPAEGSWSDDMWIMDMACDDKFSTSWNSSPEVKEPWLAINLEKEKPVNMIVITEGGNRKFREYTLEYRVNDEWKFLETGTKEGKVKIHRFDTVYADGVRIKILRADGSPAIAEMGIYCERDRILNR